MENKEIEKKLIKKLKDSFLDPLMFDVHLSILKTFWKEQGKKELLIN